MPPRAKRVAAAEGAEAADLLGLAFFAIRLHEAAGVEVLDVGAPDGAVGVEDARGHLDDGVLFEQVFVVEQGVLQHEAGGDAEGVQAQHFLVDGDEQRADFFHFAGVDAAGGVRAGAVVDGDDRGYFFSHGREEGWVGEDVGDDPEGGGGRVDDDGEVHGDFPSSGVLEGDAVLSVVELPYLYQG